MNRQVPKLAILSLICCFQLVPVSRAAEPTVVITDVFTQSNNTAGIKWRMVPAADRYEVFSTTNLSAPFQLESTGAVTGDTWLGPLRPTSFHRVKVTPLDTNAVLTGLVLSRLAYGPTPDDIERVLTGSGAIGPIAYIEEQLRPENINDDEVEAHPSIKDPKDKLDLVQADDEQIRSWHAMRAIMSKRQLLEVLLMFFDTHFNTQHDKSKEWLAGRGLQNPERRWHASDWEFRELEKWRSFLMQKNSTFEDMARVSSESPAMIIYLDTVINMGPSPNENYSREIMELFTMGVDNGYLQKDIVEMSRAWTGWRVEKKLTFLKDNPHAPTLGDGAPALNATTWTLHFNPEEYRSSEKIIFKGAMVDPRFGPEYTAKTYGDNTVPGLYQLNLPLRTGTNGMLDGYDIVAHLSNLPYTQEFISVKLCQWFVHERFAAGYDFTDPNLSEEGKLVKECMKAWRTPGPDGREGNLRSVLRTIFYSKLFQSQAAISHKVKTPLEFVASTVRAFRVKKADGTFTADSDGYSLKDPLVKMGGMKLFDREEPDGWPETGIGWLNTANLGERLRFVQHILMRSNHPKKNEYNIDSPSNNKNNSDPVALLKLKLPAAKLTDADAVVDYFMTILYPGEGRANLALSRAEAVAFLNSDATGKPNSSLFGTLDPNGPVYDERVRGVAAYLLALPRFQEQ